jgi:NAD(P)-dependent dehydrogenase (short-subunit alcohol dehydrogenase family)
MGRADFSLRGKRALVTGGSKGIGRAIALAFAEAGADVAIAARSAKELEAAEMELRAYGGTVAAIQVDLASPSAIDGLADTAIGVLGGLDILVNNAGILGSPASAFDAEREKFDELVGLNLYAPLRLAQCCRDALASGEGGVIINMATIGAIKPIASSSVYWAVKAALISMTKSLAVEWSPYKIRSVAIAAGLVRTDMGSPFIERLEELGIRRTLLGTFSNAEDVANLALFLASPAGRSANASTFVLDDGTLAMSAP